MCPTGAHSKGLTRRGRRREFHLAAERDRRIPPVELKKPLEALAVPPDHPVLASCSAIRRGLESVTQMMVTSPALPDHEQANYAGGLGAPMEAQTILQRAAHPPSRGATAGRWARRRRWGRRRREGSGRVVEG